MGQVEEVYDPTLYGKEYLAKQNKDLMRTIGATIVLWLLRRYKFGAVLDIGCGYGCYANPLVEAGKFVCAVDISEAAMVHLDWKLTRICWDLREPLFLNCLYDLILCIEVAEHLPGTAPLCETIARHCSGTVVFTAAPPGQGGTGHINCQPQKYWIDRFAKVGLSYQLAETRAARAEWTKLLSGLSAMYLANNLMIFRREHESSS